MKSSVADSHSTARLQGQGGHHASQQMGPRLVTPPPGLRRETPTATKRQFALAPAEGWLPLLLLAIAVYSVVYSIIYANWVDHTSILLLSAPLGLLSGLVIAKTSHIPQAVLHLVACLGGYWLSIWLTSNLALHISWLELLDSLRSVITQGLANTTVASNEMVFLFYLSFLSFFLGYLGSWLIYRARLPWLVGLAYCSITLVNLNYARQDLSFLVLILLAALILLIARIQLATQLERWKSEGLHTDRPWLRGLSLRCMRITSALMVVIVLAGAFFPVFSQPKQGVSFWNALDNAVTNIAHRNVTFQDPGSIFSQYQPPNNFFGDQLTITGNVNLPVGEVLLYTSNRAPQYFEGFTFDHFDGHTWISTVAPGGAQYAANGQLTLDAPDGNYDPSAFTEVTVLQPPSGTKYYIFAPTQPKSFSVPTTIYGSGITTAWVQQTPLSVGERYTVASSIPSASVDQLSSVPLPKGGGMIPWQNDLNYTLLQSSYLQIPNDLSTTVLKTAQSWTRGAQNTYQAMKMLETHLNNTAQFTYSVDNPPIPTNVDVVSWLLQTQRGYCTYYASAMTIMARLLGVPARIANGFSQGHFDAHNGFWIVNGSDAHSWVQVYFPGQGWINFDPTPGFTLNGDRGPGSSVAPTPTVPAGKATPSAAGHNPPPRHGQPGDTGNGSGASQTKATAFQNLLLEFSMLVLLCSCLLLLAAICIAWWRNLYKNASFVSGMYWRACRIASWAGFSPALWQTPYEYSRAVARDIPQVAAPLYRLTELFVRDRWAAPHEAPYIAEEVDAERLWPYLRRGLLRKFLSRFKGS